MKEKLMIDMDDVITTGGFLYLINEFLGTDYKQEHFKKYYMQDIIDNKDMFFKWFLSQNIYDHCEMLPNCYESLQELNEYYDIFIATTYIYPEITYQSGHILHQKFDYLKSHLSFIKPSKYIFLSDKSVLDFPIKIDDKIENLKNARRKILFSAYHNLELSNTELSNKGIERAADWNDVKVKLLKR